MKKRNYLLLKDLCARLPYGVICQLSNKDSGVLIVEKLELGGLEHFIAGNICVKPYLRSMSSMTEEELKEFRACHCVYDLHPDFQPMMCNIANEQNMFDWLLAHHFDYRGLIEKGLALEALKDMYKTE